MAAQGLGGAVSPALGGWIAQGLGYPAAFRRSGGFALGSLALWIGFAPLLNPPAPAADRRGRSARPCSSGLRSSSTGRNPTASSGAIAGIATAGRDRPAVRLPEFIWAVLGAVPLVVLGLLPWRDALAAVGKGTDVYLFLIGMMLLAELARQEGLFDWLAALAVRLARGSATRLFLLVYGVGTLVTVFLSNDATAVVLTPAVSPRRRRHGPEPLPYLLICAFIANAASFVLPISNPANLVIFGSHMPPLLTGCPFRAALARGDRRHLS